MHLKHILRLRVENCIGTIVDVHKSICHPCGGQEFLERFEKLKEAVSAMDMSGVTEQYVLMVEQATNALLGEFRPIFEEGTRESIYHEPIQ